MSAWQTLAPVAGIIAIAAITPGPNNFIILEAARRKGWPGAVLAGTGVVAGSLILFACVAAGLGSLFEALPHLAAILTIAGSLYIAWLGLSLLRNTPANGQSGTHLPAGVLAIALLQLANPKAWALVVTALSATARTGGDVVVVAGLLIAVTVPCLALWASFGVAVAKQVPSGPLGMWIDRTLAVLLIISAVALALPAFDW